MVLEMEPEMALELVHSLVRKTVLEMAYELVR